MAKDLSGLAVVMLLLGAANGACVSIAPLRLDYPPEGTLLHAAPTSTATSVAIEVVDERPGSHRMLGTLMPFRNIEVRTESDVATWIASALAREARRAGLLPVSTASTASVTVRARVIVARTELDQKTVAFVGELVLLTEVTRGGRRIVSAAYHGAGNAPMIFPNADAATASLTDALDTAARHIVADVRRALEQPSTVDLAPPIELTEPRVVVTPANSMKRGGPESHDGAILLHTEVGGGAAASVPLNTPRHPVFSTPLGRTVITAGMGLTERLFVISSIETGWFGSESRVGMISVGVGGMYYFMPLNLFVSAAAIWGGGHVALAVFPSHGFGGTVSVGKEWWIGTHLGLGVSAHLEGSEVEDEGAVFAEREPIRWLNVSGGLGVSFTY